MFHLLEGLPAAWLGPNMVTRLKGIATPFGPLTMELKVNAEGTGATLHVQPLAGDCRAIIVHKPDGGTMTLMPDRANDIPLNRMR